MVVEGGGGGSQYIIFSSCGKWEKKETNYFLFE
jgi:hypothetical protein